MGCLFEGLGVQGSPPCGVCSLQFVGFTAEQFMIKLPWKVITGFNPSCAFGVRELYRVSVPLEQGLHLLGSTVRGGRGGGGSWGAAARVEVLQASG